MAQGDVPAYPGGQGRCTAMFPNCGSGEAICDTETNLTSDIAVYSYCNSALLVVLFKIYFVLCVLFACLSKSGNLRIVILLRNCLNG